MNVPLELRSADCQLIRLTLPTLIARLRRPGWGRGRGKVRGCGHGQVHQDPGIGTVNDHPAERVAVMDPLRGPASLAGCGAVNAPSTRRISSPWSAGAVFVNGKLVERPGEDAPPEAA
jgi:hypothetical protein